MYQYYPVFNIQYASIFWKKVLDLKSNANRYPKFENICLVPTVDLFNARTETYFNRFLK